MESPTHDGVHAETTRMDIHDLVRTLNEHVGATVVQSMAGVRDRTAPYRWAQPGGPEPRSDAQSRLRLGYRVWRTVEVSEGPSTALAWLMGANPRLGEEMPIAYIRQLKTKEVLGAAEAFVSDTYAA
ncbi:hypothetical protein [Georgenia yuyongxinii]|uniref:DUF2384 domain-containing protein n=1 Tax=Georgenia yuyongxinii TaxID=2589797 RepID=A0A552WXQ0_9MICO|nr:hypothetical protein [Georgenia yuyongxinii]TRW47610.1 hypothetical protein FJ693_00435 [Georgenia yuyongxinii]